ncbi:MAG: restriction endonuclease subunit S [Gammaproteobacteria bacterium]|nr:restriction endonuclease subunit S [Gammaproteobacteria bacterium]
MANSANFLPANWEVRPLEELTESKNISYGIVQPGSNDPKGIPIIRVNNFSSNGLDTSNVLKVSPEIEKKFSKTRLRLGDVLLTLVGSTGQTYVVPDKYVGWNVPRAVAVIRPNSIVSSEWIKICLDSQYTKQFLDSRANTTVQKTLNLSDIKKIPIPIPPKKERAFIETCAVDLDKKLNLNSEVNQTLEKMAQALFKSWFVDFDPVIDNALAAGSEIPDALQHRVEIRKKAHALQKQNPSIQPLSAATQRLFPSEFEHCGDNTLGIQGWIPKSWEVTSFESLISLVGGGTPKTTIDDYWGGDIPWFSVVDAPNDSDVFVIDTEKHVTQLGVNKSSTKILREGTTIISARGTVGKCALVGSPMAMNQSCYGIVGKFENHDEYIYFLTRYQVSDLQKRGHGSVFNTITRETFKSISLAKSDDLLTQKFSELVRPYLTKILSNNKQNVELTKLRDVLLPKLISGEVII